MPGVGAFGDAMNKLNELELVDTIKDFAKNREVHDRYLPRDADNVRTRNRIWNSQRTRSYRGLCRFLDINLKVPHMGWNDLKFEKKDDLILKYIKRRRLCILCPLILRKF